MEVELFVIVCFIAIIIALRMIGTGMRRIDGYKWMSKEDYQQLNEKAKRIVRLRQAKKKKCKNENTE